MTKTQKTVKKAKAQDNDVILPSISFESRRVEEQQVETINYYDALGLLQTKTDHVYDEGFTEDIYTDRLSFIVSNRHIFEQQMIKEIWKDKKLSKEDTFKKAEKMLNKSRNGSIKVDYKQKNGVGRRFAIKGTSLQGLSRQIRQTIARDYVDIDMVNAHPSMCASN